MTAPLLAARNLEVFYGRYLQVLRGVTIELAAGEVVAVLGPNGAGKTTLIRTFMGLIDDQPERGELRLDDQRIEGWDTGQRVAAGLACVPEGREVFADLTVRENLIMGAWSTSAREIPRSIERVCASFPRLAERMRQRAGTLSGGEQQMLAIGRALMSRPRALLLDEPSLGLAPRVVQDIFQILAALASDGIALLIVEQNTRAALALASRGYVLESGRIVMSGSARALEEDPNVREFYLGLERGESAKGYRRYKRRRRWA